MVVDRKKTEGTSSARFGIRTAAKAANLSEVPTVFAAELKKEKVLEDKFQFAT